ncbi:hypothetical protein [Tsukamurella soli]|uniref:hypothetical protein n=1 Tax=Tsukamurella soli TaxID=644556 RepID=UPI003609C305
MPPRSRRSRRHRPPTASPSQAPESGAGGGNPAQQSAQALQSSVSRVGAAPSSGAAASGSAEPGSPGLPTPGAVTAGGACPDTSISVVVTADKPTYTLGDQPVFSATVTNAGAVPCVRDIGTGQQQLLVYTLDGTKRLWSNFDCTFQPQIKNETLGPGQQLTYGLQWAGTTSSPGCQTKRVPVPPGAYQVIAQLGEKRSSPVTFNIVKPAADPNN